MIYSESLGLRYVDVPLCASSSIKAALLESDGLPAPEGVSLHNHPRWRGPTDFGLRSFTVVRHPRDRFLSGWRKKIRGGLAKYLGCSLEPTASQMEYAKWLCAQTEWRDPHFRPWYNLVQSAGHIDHVLLLERQEEWPSLGLSALRRLNPSAKDYDVDERAIALVLGGPYAMDVFAWEVLSRRESEER